MEAASDNRLNAEWLDRTLSTQQSELPSIFYEYCKIAPCDDIEVLRERLQKTKPDLVIIDFDYPSKRDLSRIAELKVEFSSVPMLMLTVQHSESLAVWSFRSRFLDFFVKPISRSEAEQCLRRLDEITRLRAMQSERVALGRSESVPQEATSRNSDGGHSQLAPAIGFVEKNFSSRVINEDVAAACGMNPFYFSKKFKEVYEIGFHEYLTRYRLREARRLLEIPSVTITEVCFSVGFNDASHFTKVFRKYFGGNPSGFVGKPISEAFEDRICQKYSPVPIGAKK